MPGSASARPGVRWSGPAAARVGTTDSPARTASATRRWSSPTASEANPPVRPALRDGSHLDTDTAGPGEPGLRGPEYIPAKYSAGVLTGVRPHSATRR